MVEQWDDSGSHVEELIALIGDYHIGRHGSGILGEFAVKLTIHPDPDGLYLIKGGDKAVWDHFKIPKEWRKSQGVIHGKRCGTTENIGFACRTRSQHHEQGVA